MSSVKKANGLQFNPLNRENYIFWAPRMESHLIENDLGDYITKDLPAENAVGYATELAKHKKAKAIITKYVDNTNLLLIKRLTTAKEAWNALKEEHMKVTINARCEAKTRLTNIRLKSGGSMSVHFTRLAVGFEKCAELGIEYSDEDKCHIVLHSVNIPEYASHVDNIFLTLPEDSFKVENIKSKLLEVWRRQSERNFEEEDEASPMETSSNDYGEGSGGKETEDASALKVWHKKNRNSKPYTYPKPNYKPTCKHCHKVGHVRRNCFQLQQNQANFANQNHEINQESAKIARFLSHSSYMKCYLTKSSKFTAWWCDSGASSHMSNNKRDFCDIDFSQKGKILVANGEFLDYQGIGTIVINIVDGNNVLSLHLKDSLYVPKLEDNLVSIKRLTRGANVLFSENECRLLTEEFNVKIGQLVNGLYKLNTQQEESCMKVTRSKSNCIHDWHKKLAHRNLRDVKLLLNHMDITPTKCQCDDVCEACIQGKMTQAPFPRSSTVIENVYDLFVSDLCDMVDLTMSKSRYFITLIDVRSNFTYVYFLKHKSDVKDTLICHIEMMKNVLGAKPRRLRVDKGGEYKSKGLQSYFKREGIIYESTVGYASQSNGIAERKNRELAEAARTMLIDSNLPIFLWDEAVATANYVQNRLLDPITKEIPYQVYYNKTVEQLDLHCFGCYAYHKIHDHKRRKLDPKAQRLHFLGYDNESNGYRLYNPCRRQTIVSRNVIFMDDKTKDYLNEKSKMNVMKTSHGTKKVSRKVVNSKPVEHVCEDFYVEQHDTENDPDSEPEVSDDDTESSEHEDEIPESENDYETSNESLNETLVGNAANNSVDFHSDNDRSSHEASDHAQEQRQQQQDDSGHHEHRRTTRQNAGVPNPDRYGWNYDYNPNDDEGDLENDENVEVLYLSTCLGVYEPKTFKQAMKCDENVKWQSAMLEEMSCIERNQTWELVDLPRNKNVIGCRWVFKAKPGLSHHHQYKARLVAQGFNQKFGIDYDEIFAPVATDSSFRLLMSEVGVKNLIVKQFDIKSAFLNGRLEEEIYMKQPPGFISHKYPDKVLKLKRSLYGLKQAANTWNKALNKVLTKMNFKPNPADLCLYTRKEKNNAVCHVLIHVDDILIASNQSTIIANVAATIGGQFEIKDLGVAKHYLGMNIFRDKNNDVFINQSQYIDNIVTEAKLDDSKVSKFPLDSGYYKVLDSKPLTTNDEYRKLIGKLLYLSTHSRPDITASVCILSQKVSSPTQIDLNEVKRIIRYLKHTKHLKLRLSDKNKSGQLKIFTDSDFAEDPITRKSVGGYICFYNGGAVSWSSRKQDIVALSSMEAEYIALSESVKEGIWLAELIQHFKKNCYSRTRCPN